MRDRNRPPGPPRATSRGFMTASSLDLALLCGTLIVPKHKLEKRRLVLEYTFGPATTVSRDARAAAPPRCSSTSSALASEYER